MKYSLRNLMGFFGLALGILLAVASIMVPFLWGSNLPLLAFWIVAVCVILLSRPEWMVPPYQSKWWSMGEYDPVRYCLYNENGKVRRFVAAALLIWVTLWTLLVAILTQVFP